MTFKQATHIRSSGPDTAFNDRGIFLDTKTGGACWSSSRTNCAGHRIDPSVVWTRLRCCSWQHQSNKFPLAVERDAFGWMAYHNARHCDHFSRGFHKLPLVRDNSVSFSQADFLDFTCRRVAPVPVRFSNHAGVGGWRTLDQTIKLGAPSFPQFYRGKGGNHESQPAVFFRSLTIFEKLRQVARSSR